MPAKAAERLPLPSTRLSLALREGKAGMNEQAAPVGDDHVVDAGKIRMVIAASSVGTVFEWYDFFI